MRYVLEGPDGERRSLPGTKPEATHDVVLSSQWDGGVVPPMVATQHCTVGICAPCEHGYRVVTEPDLVFAPLQRLYEPATNRSLGEARMNGLGDGVVFYGHGQADLTPRSVTVECDANGITIRGVVPMPGPGSSRIWTPGDGVFSAPASNGLLLRCWGSFVVLAPDPDLGWISRGREGAPTLGALSIHRLTPRLTGHHQQVDRDIYSFSALRSKVELVMDFHRVASIFIWPLPIPVARELVKAPRAAA